LYSAYEAELSNTMYWIVRL